MSSSTAPARTAHLNDTYLADHSGHPLTVKLCALALGLLSDLEAANIARPDLDGFIVGTVAPRLAAALTSDVVVFGQYYVTDDERAIMQAQLDAHALN